MAINQLEEHVWEAEPGFFDTHAHPRAYDPLTLGGTVPENNGYEGKAGLRHFTQIALKSGITAIMAVGNESLRLPDPTAPQGTVEVSYPIGNLDRALGMASRICGEAQIPTGFYTVIDPKDYFEDDLDDPDFARLHEDKLQARLTETAHLSSGNKTFLALSTGGFVIPAQYGARVARIGHKVSPGKPNAFHAEGADVARLLEAVAAFPEGKDIALHILHISSREELEAVIQAKQQGMSVTCEMTPHHGMLTHYSGKRVKPPLKTRSDIDYLWNYIEYIDTFGSDCAPHRISDKNDAKNPAAGLATHTTMLPALFQAVNDGKLTMEQLNARTIVNPRRIFGLAEDDGSRVKFSDGAGETTSPEVYDKLAGVEYQQSPYYGLPEKEQQAVRLAGRILKVKLATNSGGYNNLLAPMAGNVSFSK